MSEKLRESKGLRLSSVIDGASRELEELIQFSTHPEVSSRLDSAKDFTEWLTRVEAELTTPEEIVVQNPAEAKAGDRLRHGFAVKARLGHGSTAVALLVERDGTTTVLALRLCDMLARLNPTFPTATPSTTEVVRGRGCPWPCVTV